jgi:hypothetical protein
MTRSRWIPPKEGEKEGAWVPVKGEATLHFKEFETPQLTRGQAEAIGAHFDEKDGITTVRYEKGLREHLARERGAGRDVRWREHDERKRRPAD